MAILAGIDGCKDGWMCVIKNTVSGALEARILSRIGEWDEWVFTPDIIAIDIPIGLAESGPRACDIEARARLKGRASSVFPAPLRAMIGCKTYREACDAGMALQGKKLSKQCWELVPKIREMDDYLRERPEWKSRIHEIHPELSFCFQNGERPMVDSKKTVAGAEAREALIRKVYADAYDRIKSKVKGRYAEDLRDAFAALMTAERILAGTAVVLPETPPVDSQGLRTAIAA